MVPVLVAEVGARVFQNKHGRKELRAVMPMPRL
jgi:hypothetical protein